MTPLTPAPSSSPAAGGSARSNRTAPPPANRTAAGYTGAEGVSTGNSSAAGTTHAAGTADAGRETSHVNHESGGCGHGAVSAISNPTHTTYLVDHVARMQAEIERTTRRLEMEKRRLHELGESSRKAQHEFHDKRLRYSFNKAGAQAERLKAENTVLLLENRLSQALCKLDSGNDDINKLKALIDKHRKDRLAMEKVYRHVHRELAHHTEHLNDVKEKLTQLQEWEHQSTRRMDELNKAKEQEREAFKQHCLSMQKELREQDRLIKEFDIRAHRESSMQRTQMKGSPYSVAEEEHTFNPESLMKLIFKTALLNAVHRHNIRQYKNKISVFEKAMESIKTSTGISDAEEIVSIFSQLEERNYSVMTYVNNINVELESLESKKRQLEMHMQQQAHHDATAQRLTDETLRDVAAQISNTKLATDGKNALIQRQLQGLLQSHEMLQATANLIRSCWKGPDAFEEPAPHEPGPFGTSGEKRDLLPMLWFIQKFFESHKEVLRQAKNDTGLAAAIAAAHAWVAAHASAAANTHAAGSGGHPASGGTHAAAAAMHAPGGRHASLAAAYTPNAGVNSLGSRAIERGSSSGSGTQGRVYAGGVYVRGRSSPVTATTPAATGGAAGGGPGCSGSRATGLSAGSPTGGNNPWSGGSLSHRRTIGLAIASGFRSSARGHAAGGGETRASSIDMQLHTRKQLTRSVTGRKISGHSQSAQDQRSLSAAASPVTTGAAASAAIASSDDATTGACDAGETQRCATADSCIEIAAGAAGGTERAARSCIPSAGGSRAPQRATRAKAAAESRSAPSDEEEEEERDEDSSDEKSPIPGNVVPLSSEELREKTIHLFNRMRKKKAAAEGYTQPLTLYLPEKRCLLASPGARDGVAALQPLLLSVANSPLPGSPSAAAGFPPCVLPQQLYPSEAACAAVRGAAGGQNAAPADPTAGTELPAAKTAGDEREQSDAEYLAQNKDVSVTGEAATWVATGQQQRHPERRKTDSAGSRGSAGSVEETSHPARRSSTTNNTKEGDTGGGLRKKPTVPHFLTQSGRMLFGRQKEKQYSKVEPARRSVAGAAISAAAQPKRSTGSPQVQLLQQQQRQQHQQSSQTAGGTETKSSKFFGGEPSFWRRRKIAKPSADQNSIRQGERSSYELQAKPVQPQQQTEKSRHASSVGVGGRASTSSRKKSLSTQGSKEVKTQLQQQAAGNTQTGQDEQGGQQQKQHGETHPGKQPPTRQTQEQRQRDEGQQEPHRHGPQEQQRHEQQEKQRCGQQHPQAQQPQQGIQQLDHSQQETGNALDREQQAVGTTIHSATEEAQTYPSPPNAVQRNPEQQKDSQEGRQDLIRQQNLEPQDGGGVKTIRHSGAPFQAQTEDDVCSMQQVVQREEPAQQQYLQAQNRQAETHLEPSASPGGAAVRQQGGEGTHSREPGELNQLQQKATVEREQKQHDDQQQSNCQRQQQPLRAWEESQNHQVEQQPPPADSSEEVPASLSVVLRQVPINREPEQQEGHEGQPQQQATAGSGRSAALPVRFSGLPELMQGDEATTEAAETLRQAQQEQTAATEATASEETTPASAPEGGAGDEACTQRTRPDVVARPDGQEAVVSPSSSRPSGGSTSGDNTSNGLSSIPFDLGKRSSATVLAALWERCETLAAEEEAAARQQEQQQQRAKEAAERGAGEENTTETPQPRHGAQSNQAQKRKDEEFPGEHYTRRLESDDATEAARQSLLRVVENALVQVDSLEEGQQQEEKDRKGPIEQQQQQSRPSSAASAGAPFYASSPFSFLPVNSDGKLGSGASLSPSSSAGIVPAAAAKTSSATPALPSTSLHERAGDSPVGAESRITTRQVENEVNVEGGEEAKQRSALCVENNKVRPDELHEQQESQPEQQRHEEGTPSQSAGEHPGSGPLQGGLSANLAAHSSSSGAVGSCSGNADSDNSGTAGSSSSTCVTGMNAGALPGYCQQPEYVASGAQSLRPKSSPAEQSAMGNATAVSPVASAAGGSGKLVLSSSWIRQQAQSPGRPASPLPPTVAAAAFQAIRAATASSSNVSAVGDTDGRRPVVPYQRPGSAAGGAERRFSAGAASAAARINSAGPRVMSAAFLNTAERSSAGPSGSNAVSSGFSASAEPAPPTACAAVPVDLDARALLDRSEATRATLQAAAAAAAEELAAAPFASGGGTLFPPKPGKPQQLSAPPSLRSQRGELKMPADACSSVAGTGPAVAGAAALQQTQQGEQQQEEVRGSLRSGADLVDATSAVAGGGTQKRVEDDGVLSQSSPSVSCAPEAKQQEPLLLEQLRIAQPGSSSKSVTTTYQQVEGATATSALHAVSAADVASGGVSATAPATSTNIGGTASTRAPAEGNAHGTTTASSAEGSKETRNDGSESAAVVVGGAVLEGSRGPHSASSFGKEAANFPYVSAGTAPVASFSASSPVAAAAAAALQSPHPGLLPSSNAGTRPHSRGGPPPGTPLGASPLPRERVAAAAAALAASSASSLGRPVSGTPLGASPLPRERVAAAAAALAASSSSSLGRPVSGTPPGFLTPVVAAGARPGPVSPATLALLRQRSGVSSANADKPSAAAALNATGLSSVAATPTAAAATPSATAESVGQSQPPPSRQPSLPAAVAAAVAAGAVVTISSSPLVGGLPGSRPLSAQLAAGRLAFAGHASRQVGAEEVQFQHRQQAQQQHTRNTNDEQEQEMQKQPHTPTSPTEEQAPGAQREKNHQLQRQEQEQQGDMQQISVNSNAASPTSASANPPRSSSDVSSTKAYLPTASHLSEADSESRRQIHELRGAAAGTAAEEGKHGVASSPLPAISSSCSPAAVRGDSASQLPAFAAAGAFSDEEHRNGEHCLGGSSTPAAEGKYVSGPAAAPSSTEVPDAASLVATEPSDSTLGQKRAYLPQVETVAEEHVATKQQQMPSSLERDEQQLQQPYPTRGITSDDGIVDGVRGRREKKENQQGAERLQSDLEETKREDDIAQHTEVELAANSERLFLHPAGAPGAAASASASDSVAPEENPEQQREVHSSDEAAAVEQGQAAEVSQATQPAGTESNSPGEVRNDESHITVATGEAARKKPADASVRTSGADSPVGHKRAAQPAGLSEEEKSSASGAVSTPVAEVSAVAASTDAFDRTATAAHPRAATACPTAGATASPILPFHSDEHRRPASVGNKHVSMNLEQEQEQRHQLHQQQDEEEQQQPYPYWQQPRRSRQSQHTRRSHMSLLSPNRRSTRLSNAELFQFSPPDLQLPEKDSPPGTPPSASSSRPETAPNPTAQEPAEEVEAFSAVVEGNRFVARVSRVERIAPKQLNQIDEE